MIRPATVSDIPDCVEMFEALIEAHPLGGLMGGSRANLSTLLVTCMNRGTVLVAGDVESGDLVGMIAIFATDHHLSGLPIGHEIAFWVAPEHRAGGAGVRLLQAAEAWACKKSLSVLQIMSPVGSDLSKFYARQGYEEVETVFLKRL